MSFKVGEKLVFVIADWADGGLDAVNLPQSNEVVTCGGVCPFDGKDGYWILKEYRYNKSGGFQSFHSDCLRKLSEVSSELSEEILEKIKVTEEEPITA